MVKLAAQRSQARFYVAKAVPIRQLSKGHRQVLIPTGEASRSHIPVVSSYTASKLAIRQEAQQLREDGSALVHSSLSVIPDSVTEASPRFKSRQAKCPSNSQQKRHLLAESPSLAGQLWFYI
jgi:NADP-dependent 3-hydroxy acid dehydrogenase YdfG